jgi:hypothetical protein
LVLIGQSNAARVMKYIQKLDQLLLWNWKTVPATLAA